MDKNAQIKLIVWTKRGLGVTAFFIWIFILYTIMQTSAPFMEQAPYCMAGTMLTFGVLTAVFKGLERWEAHITKGKDHE
ncbi:hypothetical protein PGH07_09075 [Sulfurovum sp. zt1-1]|uniref:Uncharacterized protein n=1 Tax=Sulfurovum zhangzhouensis TaxID=3019067 RepID=A0ABT7QZX0_9BACT|nr:hypothetical protein [Sulfurovum zhangzhouensis]MDM5272333.1 hypothetical protein [Sulfurovum zhangzhouensis]